MTNILKRSKQNLPFDVDAFLIRALDVIGAALGLFLLAPLFLVISLMIKLTSAGPIFYKAKRVGQGEHLFFLYKFRSMYLNADRLGPGITVHNDPRITLIGRFLRRTKLDELPQLINVLRGEMSLIGPRPEDPRYVASYTPEQRQVLTVRPGITSLASRHYREEEKFLIGDNWEQIYREKILPRKLAADLAYLQRRTFWSDIYLILETIVAITNGGQFLNWLLEMRNRHFFILDILSLLCIPAMALTLRLDGFAWWPESIPALRFYTGISLLVKILIFYQLRLYNYYWRYAGVNDLSRVLIAVGLSTIILETGFMIGHVVLLHYDLAMYRAVPLIDGLLTVLAVGGSRFSIRALYHWHRQHQLVIGGRRVLVVGAGESGTMVVREMQANPQLDMEPVAFVDDDPAKIGIQIQGLPVLSSTKDIPTVVEQHQIQKIIVAIPSLSFQRQRELLATCNQTGIPIHILPGVYEILAGYKTISQLPTVDINRLLHRAPVKTDQAELTTILNGARVLVTGAGGSIGSELCRQIARFNPAEIILLGHGENSIFEINLDLRLSFPTLKTCSVIVDVRDTERVNWVVEKWRPDVIFHAAAHKHVPLMEDCAREAITNNVLGTRNLLYAAEMHEVKHFILISTDKAVNPTSVMGASKRLAELLVIAAAQRSKRAYMAVRFGNVLGSRGSVIPIFQRQIATGGPVTITDPNMRRYFMTIPEAVQLVLQATVLGQGGELFVLDMGQPVQILDLATNLIKMAGLEPERDIKIAYTGARPGEKLSEELFLVNENYRRTRHSKIFVATPEDMSPGETFQLEKIVIELLHLIQQIGTRYDDEQIRVLILTTLHHIDKYQSGSLLPKAMLTSALEGQN